MDSAQVTIVLLVSRTFLLEKLFTRLNELTYKNTSLLVIVDGDLNTYLTARKYVDKSDFSERLCIRSEVKKPVSKSQIARRKRIADLHNEARQYLQTSDYVLCLEDDGIPPKNCIEKLLDSMGDNIGFVSGVELGRWQSRYIGAWHMKPIDEPTEITSITYKDNVIIEVESAGLYCLLVKKDLYESHHFIPGTHYGPDLDFGLKLKKKGYNNLVDTSIKIDHYSESGRIFSLDTDIPQTVSMQKRKGTWRFVHVVQKV